MTNNKGDQLIWWLMITFASLLIVGGGAWATTINNKVERITAMEINLQYIQNDVADIKHLIKKYVKEGE